MTKDELNSSLLDAACKGNLDDLKTCLMLDADVNAKDENGWTALMYAVADGHTENVATLLKVPGIDVNAKDKAGWAALMLAAANGRAEIVEVLLRHHKIDVNAKNKKDETVLAWAAAYGYTKIVDLLKKAGAVL